MFRALHIENRVDWEDALNGVAAYDFYHTWDYNNTSFNNGEGIPVLCIYENDKGKVVFPILKRSVVSAVGSELYDFTSVYGYAGPLSSPDIDQEVIDSFALEFKKYCVNNNIVSGFSRLHPLIEQDNILNSIGTIEKNSKTVTIDLSQTLEEQRKHYRKSNKSEINQLRRKATIVWSDKSEEDIKAFMDIYNANMKRVDAKGYYFFNEKYYNDFFNGTGYDAQLLFVEIEDEKVAGAIFVFCDNIIQYHLAGTHEDFLRVAPIKLLLDELRLYGTEKNYGNLHLGGGTSRSEEDPLFKFKRGFSKIFLDFKVFKSIFDQEKYDALSDAAREKVTNFDESFFPLYRNSI